MDTYNFGTGNGTNIVQWSYWGGDSQRYQVTHLGNGYHRISPVISTGQALDVSGVSSSDGANIQTWQWNGGNNQQWSFISNGNGRYQIRARHSNKCVDVEYLSTSDGANIQQWTCVSGQSNQLFEVRSANSGQLELVQEDFKIFPNPSSNGSFSINCTGSVNDNYRMDIYSVEGKKVYETDYIIPGENRFDTKLNKGVYFVRINGTNISEHVQKLVIK